jgi:hypothetical protein
VSWNAQSILAKEQRIAEIPSNIKAVWPIEMNEIIFLIEEAPEGGFTARALGQSIFTEADSMDALRDQIRDAVRCHFDEGKSPKVIRLHFVREEVIAA